MLGWGLFLASLLTLATPLAAPNLYLLVRRSTRCLRGIDAVLARHRCDACAASMRCSRGIDAMLAEQRAASTVRRARPRWAFVYRKSYIYNSY